MKTAILLVTGNSLSLAETLHQEMNDSEIFTLEHFHLYLIPFRFHRREFRRI